MTPLFIAIAVLAFACALLAFKLFRSRREARNLREEIDHWRVTTEIREARLRDVEATEARFRKELAWYAHASTWAPSAPGKHSAAAKDRGENARTLLAMRP